MTAMGSLYCLGRGCCGSGEPYFEAAASLWRRAARAGDSLAGLKLGTLLVMGVPGHLEQDFTKVLSINLSFRTTFYAFLHFFSKL